MRILHVIANLDFAAGGPPRACLAMARAVAQRGHRVTIITTDRNIPSCVLEQARGSAVDSDVAIEAYPSLPPGSVGISLPMWGRLRAAIPRFDIVHLHSLYLFHVLITARHCRLSGVPYIVRPHGTLVAHVWHRHRGRKRLAELLFQNRALKLAAGLHYATEHEWREAQPYALNSRGCIVPNAVDLAPFDRLPARELIRRRYPEIGDRKVLLYLGRLGLHKGVEVVIETFARAATNRSDLHLVIAGPDDGLRAEAEALVDRHAVRGRVTFTGMITGEDKSMVLAGSDVFVLPSLGESFGIAVAEAAASGLPLVISDRVGICKDFADADACLAAPPAPQEFAAHVCAILDDPRRARKMADRARDLVSRNFAARAVGERLEQAYLRAVETGSLPELPKVRRS